METNLLVLPVLETNPEHRDQLYIDNFLFRNNRDFFLVCCQLFLQADPKELIQMVTKHVTQYAHADWPEEISSLINQLHYYNERLLDFTQAQTLQGLGKGVDVQRFTADAQYKRETILGLAE